MFIDVRSNTPIIEKQREIRARAETAADLAEACTATSCKTTPIWLKSVFSVTHKVTSGLRVLEGPAGG